MTDSHPTSLKLTKIRSLFNGIARRYDGINRVMTFGLDVQWRRQMVRHLPDKDSLQLLDLATGTADVPLALCQHSRSVAHVVGLDVAMKMLEKGRQKVSASAYHDRISLRHGDAMHIEEKDAMFDGVTMAFGIRNVDHTPTALAEILRVLTPGGRVIILETSRPRNRVWRWGHSLYLSWIMPMIGGVISGRLSAYRYLSRSTAAFPCGEAFCAVLRQAGFHNVTEVPLFGGVATIYVGHKAC